jgi:hypothetical protein
MTPIDHREVAKAVYDLANSSSPIAPQVKEALEVIDSALDFFKCVGSFSLLSSPLSTKPFDKKGGSTCR